MSESRASDASRPSRDPAIPNSTPTGPAYHVDTDPIIFRRNARNGLILFAVYVVLYLGFMYMSAFQREAMQKPSLAGVNFGTVYGIGLIFAAFLLALVYMVLCVGSSGRNSRP